MKDQLVTFETAKLAKEKGFNEKCIESYTNAGILYAYNKDKRLYTNKELLHTFYSAPTQSLLQKWLREKHKIHAFAHPIEDLNSFLAVVDATTPSGFERLYISGNEFETYEQALLSGLQEAIKLIE